jgi:uncharacterized repeat protein (TIGR03803 family)
MAAMALTGCVLAATSAGAASYSVVYALQGGSDGSVPQASLHEMSGTLYGTTGAGGIRNGGTVFGVTPAGAETVLHAFTGAKDGRLPAAGLINAGSTLYGTTVSGGHTANCSGGCGTVFSLTPAGEKKTLLQFKGGSDGDSPQAGLVNVGGTFYGTTIAGGGSAGCAPDGCGTVFSVTRAGVEKVVYAFQGGSDGEYPGSGLINVGGTLYGTTEFGGLHQKGTVFSITPTATKTVLYAFKGGSDGAVPQGDLVNVGGTLYGTTFEGGADNGGTIFSVTPAGTETVLYSFTGGNDGSLPSAGLVNVGGTLYGTTISGGADNLGTVFSVTELGAETVLHSFAGGSDGANPYAGLIDVGGTLYGTTGYGGEGANCKIGCGTVFSLTP